MKITSLVENTTLRRDMQVEHGLSLHIETEKHKILFDMGQSHFFYENAKKLGIDLANVDFAILSHGHYDHGGGLEKFLEINSFAPVYIHKDAFLPHYNGTEKYIGLDTKIMNNERIIFTDDKYEIFSGLNLYSCNEKKKKYKAIPSGLNLLTKEGFVEDDFRHEQYLLIEENEKKILISGCSHKGILDIVSWFSPQVLIGGFHYSKLPLDDDLRFAAQILSSYDTTYYTCHCTGVEQFEFMREISPNIRYFSCGESIIL